ncbi:MAG: PQQ-binding-like beta-propeller repeat protein [Bacteroidales bacterium]|nr:PQQ-binding-like beta-propeller repeat protein [Candidatus Cacconaster merdequi]
MKYNTLFLAASLLMLFAGQSLSAQVSNSFDGTVFNDRNGNGILDKGERGVQGVAVSDGFTVTLTDKEGHYSISPNPRARFITVSTPDGWRNTNRFFTDVREAVSGVKLTGEILNRSNEGLDFGIARCKVYGSFAHMSDVEDRIYLEWIDRMKEYALIHDQDFIAVTGDICYENGLKFFAKAMTDLNMGRRMVYTIGNHDLIRGNKDYLGNDYGEKNFEDCFGPAWYSFNAAGVHFIVTPMLMGDAKPSYSADDINAWIQKDLETIPSGTPVMMFNHDAATKLVPENANVKAFIYGHRHDDLRTVTDSGVTFYCTMSPSKGSNDHSASALREFIFNEKGEMTSKMHYCPLSNHIVSHETGGNVKAVVYDAASEPVKAEVILPDGRKVAMHQVSDMMWEADLQKPLPAGTVYKVAAEFTDGERIISRQVQEKGLRWMTTLPCKTFFTDPIISDGHLFIAGMDNENGQDCAVFSIDAASGAIEWATPVKNSVKGDMALMDGILYAGDVDYNVYAIDSSNGDVKWSKRVDVTFYPSFTEGIHAADGLVFAGCAHSLCALDATTGETVWTNRHNHGAITNVNTNRTAAGALLTNGYWVGRFCYDAATGNILWEKKDHDNRYSSCTPAVLDTTFIYTGYSSIMQVGARSGEVIKSNHYPFIFNTRSEPLIIDGKIFVGSSNNGLLAVNFEDMSQAWNFLTEPAVIYTSPYTKNREKTVESSPAAFGENVVFGANDGYVYCVRRSDGLFVWSLKIGLPVLCKPQIDGNLMYISDFAGNIYCYEL